MVRKHGYPYPIPYNLSNCDQEPLRFIATVQAHAALFVCSADELKILQATDNCLERLGIACEEILQKKLSEALPPPVWKTIEAALDLGENYLVNNPIRVGMAIVKRIAEKHQARIEVESEVGKGSTFHFHFPLPDWKNDEN